MYKSYPWYCMVCDRMFHGGVGRASHHRGKKHKENLAKLQAMNLATKPKDSLEKLNERKN